MLKTTHYDAVTRIDMARSAAGRGYYWTTAYLVDGMMVDTGCAHTARELAESLKDEPLALIVNTHSHEDHIGANSTLQQQRDGLETLAHPLAIPIMAQPRELQPLHPYRRMFWGWPESSTGQPVQDQQSIVTEHRSFRVIYTPGHSPDHICLFEEQRGWLFSGDLFVGGKDRALRADFDIWQIIAALKHVADLPITRIFPGSARVRENPSEELDSKVSYLERVGHRVLELHRKGWSVQAIARTLFGGPMLVEFLTLGHFSRRRLVLSYLRKRSCCAGSNDGDLSRSGNARTWRSLAVSPVARLPGRSELWRDRSITLPSSAMNEGAAIWN